MKLRERALISWAIVSVGFVCIALFSLMTFLLYNGLLSLSNNLVFGSVAPMQAIWGTRAVWDGIWPAIRGTFSLLVLTLCFAFFPGVSCGVFLSCYASPTQKKWLGIAVELLAGIPSIVMGLFGFVLILFLRQTLFPQATTGILLASFCLSLLVLPSLVIATRTALDSLPTTLSITGAALGFTQEQTVMRLMIPAAGKGILSGMILAMGRAAEDTAVIMLTGAVANTGLSTGLFSKFEALPFFIFYTAAQYSDESELSRAFGAALLLLALSSGMLFVAWKLQKALERRWKGENKWS